MPLMSHFSSVLNAAPHLCGQLSTTHWSEWFADLAKSFVLVCCLPGLEDINKCPMWSFYLPDSIHLLIPNMRDQSVLQFIPLELIWQISHNECSSKQNKPIIRNFFRNVTFFNFLWLWARAMTHLLKEYRISLK